MGTQIAAGIFAGVPLGVLGVLYVFARGRIFATLLTEGTDEYVSKSPGVVMLFLFAAFGVGPLFLGAVAGLLLALLGSVRAFQAIVLGLGGIIAIAGAFSRPLPLDKSITAIVIALSFAILVPQFALM